MTFGPLLDFADFCGRLRVSQRTGRRIIRAGKIGVLRIEGSVRIPEAELERFLVERFIPPHAPVRAAGPQGIEGILDRVIPAKRGRPRVGG